MKLEVERPTLLVDVSRLGHDRIELLGDGSVRIGAAVRNSDVAADRTIRQHVSRCWRRPSSLARPGSCGTRLRPRATSSSARGARISAMCRSHATSTCPGRGCPARQGDTSQPRDPRRVELMHRHAPVGHGCRAGGARRQSPRHRARGRSDGRAGGALSDARRRPARRDDTGPRRAAHRGRSAGDGSSRARRRCTARSATGLRSRSPSYPSPLCSTRTRASCGVSARLALGGVAPDPPGVRSSPRLSWRALSLTAEALGRAADAELAQAEPLRDNAFKVPLARHLIVDSLLDLAGASR